MLAYYNRIVISSFKQFLQSVNTNNLAEVLQALKELNFMLANRASELALHYNMVLEPCQITAEEVSDLVRVHLNHSTVYNLEDSIRGRPCSRGNQHHQYSQRLLPLPRYIQHSERSDTHFYSNRNYSNTNHPITSQHNSPHTVRNTPNTSNNLMNPIPSQSLNKSNIIECLQSQILGLQMQALQHSTLNPIQILIATTKVNLHHWHRAWKMQLNYATWTHSA